MEYILYLKLLGLIIFGLILGFLSAIPVGAVQLEVAKKAINGHLKPAIAVALGSATSDLIYGVLTLFGLGNVLTNKDFQTFIYICGIVVLSFIFFRSLREYRRGPGDHDTQYVYKKRISFLTGFTIAITNPGMVIWWIVGFKLFLDLALFEEINAPIKMLFVMSGCFGLGGYLIFIAKTLNRMQKSFSDRFLIRMNLFLMVLLVILIGYFLVKVISITCNYNLSLP